MVPKFEQSLNSHDNTSQLFSFTNLSISVIASVIANWHPGPVVPKESATT